jgi:hypothetical protein
MMPKASREAAVAACGVTTPVRVASAAMLAATKAGIHVQKL